MLETMRRALITSVLLLALTAPVFAYGGNWHVVENLKTQTCYRVHNMAPREGWRDFGAFNTFRMAGAWIWRHRANCRSSPAFR